MSNHDRGLRLAGVGGPEALLATKLHLLGIRPGFVPRPRLADRLTAQGSG